MADERYNGWTNYETWRVNLEYFDGVDPEQYEDCFADIDLSDTDGLWWAITDRIGDLADSLRDEVEMYVDMTVTDDGWVRGWCMAFVGSVNWYEIAKHIGAEICQTMYPDLEYWKILKAG